MRRPFTRREYYDARNEHAWLLRAEGLLLREVGERFGFTQERARAMIERFGRRVDRALGETKDYARMVRLARQRWDEIGVRRNAGNTMW